MGLVDLIALKEQAVQKIRRLAFVLGLLLSFSGFGQEADLVLLMPNFIKRFNIPVNLLLPLRKRVAEEVLC